MVKPFKLLNSKTEKEKSRYSLPREIGGVLWAECQSNVGGDYGFKGESVTLKILWATGFVDSSHKWLVGSIENWQDAFDILHQKIEGKNEKGYNNYVDNPEQSKTIETWEEQGALTAICCDGIPQLEYLAEFAVGRVIFNHTGYPVYLTGKPDKASFDFAAKTILEAKNCSFDYSIKHNKIPEMKKFKQENSWFYILWDEELYSDPDMIEFTRLAPVLDNEIITVEFEDGYLSKAAINWTPPEVKKQGDYSRGGGGSKGQSEAEIIKDRVAFVTSELKVNSLLELSEKYGNELCPIHVDMVMSLVTSSSWTNHHYYSQTKPLYNQLYNGNGNGKLEEEEPSTTEEPEAHKEDKEDKPLYLAKCVQLLNAEDRTFPVEINVEFLRQQSEEWLTLFFQFCTGSIETNQGDKTPFAKGTTRAVHTWVKLRCPETGGLHTLTVKQLNTLIEDKDFKLASELTL